MFNADQIEGLPAYFRPVASLELVEPAGREDELDRFFAAIPANLRNAGSEAYYEPGIDRITMPPASLFTGFDHYYATLAHEVCNIASVLISRIIAAATRCFAVATRHIGGRLDLQPRLAGFAASGRES